MISVEEALRKIDQNVQPLPGTTIPVSGSLGYSLSEDIVAGDDVPDFDNSAMDGYAVRTEDVAGAEKDNPAKLTVTGEAPAGSPSEKSLNPGEAIRIMTGGMVPQGTDAVIRVEDTILDGDTVHILAPANKGQNIRSAGNDIKKGGTVLSAGEPITPAGMGILASLGVAQVPVYRKPRVAFMITGDELLQPGDPLVPGKIRNSNQFTLTGMLEECGVEWTDLGTGGDSIDVIKQKISSGMDADMIITSGAVSVGKYDFVKEAFEQLGMKQLFWRIAQKPGKPLLFGLLDGIPHNERRIPVFGLPGNPVSTMVTFLVYAKTALAKMKGLKNFMPEKLTAELTKDYQKKPGLTHFVRGRYVVKDGAMKVAPADKQGSGILQNMSRSNCLIVFEEESSGKSSGSLMEIIPF